MTTVPQPVQPTSTAATTRPRPINGLGTATVALFAAVSLYPVVTVVEDWSRYQLVSDHVSGRISQEAFWQQQYSGSGMSLALTALVLPILLASIATWLVWVHRARTNAGVLSPGYGFRYSAGGSVGRMLVPLANTWWYRPILEDIAAGSSPDGPADDAVRQVRTWWWTMLGALVAALAIRPLFPSVHTLTYTPDGQLVGGGADAVQGYLGIVMYNSMLALMFFVNVVLLGSVIRRISRRQTEALFPPRAA